MLRLQRVCHPSLKSGKVIFGTISKEITASVVSLKSPAQPGDRTIEIWLDIKYSTIISKYISTMFFQIELPRDSMIVGRNRGHVTSRAKRVKYKAEVEAILSLSRGVIHLKEHS